jgi:uncharacterized phiE125 gp8 family phage protein
VIRSVLALPIEAEPLTLDEAKLRAGLDWTVGDPRDALMTDFIMAARAQVEQDTGLALPEQERDLLLDTVPGFIAYRDLPTQCTPLVAVSTVTAIDSAGAETVLDPTAYTVVLSNDGLALTILTPPADVQRYVVRITSGFELLPPSLLQAVGLLTAHYATIGRDLAIEDKHVVATPYGYPEAIQAWRRETLT